MAPGTQKSTMTTYVSPPLGGRQVPLRKTALVFPKGTSFSTALSGVNPINATGPALN